MSNDCDDEERCECHLPGPLLTQFEWHTSTNAEELLEHAVPLIPSRHTSLVLAEIAESVWPNWHHARPEDWRPAWLLATVRAWCFGQAAIDEVFEARENARDACDGLMRVGGNRPNGWLPAWKASGMALTAASYATDEPTGPIYADAARHVVDWTVSALADASPDVESVSFASLFAHSSPFAETKVYSLANGYLYDSLKQQRERELQSRFADLIRRLVPYPSRLSRQWVQSKRRIFAGDAVLEHDGWGITAAVSRIRRPVMTESNLN